MALGSSNPKSVSAFRIGSDKPSDLNVVKKNIFDNYGAKVG